MANLMGLASVKREGGAEKGLSSVTELSSVERGRREGLPDLMDFMQEEELGVEMPRYSLDGFSVEGERSGSRVDVLFT